MRLLVAVGLWLLFFFAGFGAGVLNSTTLPSGPPILNLAGVAGILIFWAMLVGIIVTIIRVGKREWGVKWYYVLALLIPFYNVFVCGQVIWYWAGRITGARPIQPEVGAVSNRP